DAGEMKAMEERLRKNTFSLDDFLSQIQQLKKMGPLGDLLEMMPGGGQIPADVKQQMAASSGDGLKVTEAIIRSMTPKEREHPEIISASRRRRIAAGSGTRVQDVNELLKRFEGAKKMARTLKKSQKRLLRFGK
ncbi:MAG TPA: signal recognition particle protein, partial [Kiritimatiellia bacterium]|nr:signal recognition particle protein [Kiritimatiellia bacterium]